jgi:hypothetical protein
VLSREIADGNRVAEDDKNGKGPGAKAGPEKKG